MFRVIPQIANAFWEKVKGDDRDRGGERRSVGVTVFSFASFDPLFLTKNLEFQIYDLKCFFMRPSEDK